MPKVRLFVTDLDRTLIDPEQAVDVLDQIAAEKGYAARDSFVTVAHSRKGLDFDFFEYLERELHFQVLQIDELIRIALDRTDPKQLFFDDTQAYLEGVTEHEDSRLLILTYGRERWQKLKLRLSGLDSYPHIITEDSNKGATIARWRQKGQTIPPGHPELAADEAIGVDDKISGLKGLERGYLVNRADMQGTDRDDGIIVVKDLYQVLTYEGLML